MNYKNLFFDLDDTIWAFSQNSREAFTEIYRDYAFDRYFHSFEHYYSLYQQRNVPLWTDYANGEITKKELNRLRFLHPLQAVGVNDEELARRYSEDLLSRIPLRSALMPHARKVLEYLSPKYRLFILSNGFREQQARKLESADIGHFFRKIILSEDIGVMKPWPEIYHFALSATQSELKESLMIGDSWENDIEGAKNAGMHQVFYNVTGKDNLPFRPTFHIRSLCELEDLL